MQLLINEILNEINNKCSEEVYLYLNNFITMKLNEYKINKNANSLIKYEVKESEKWFKMFFISKKLQGLSERSLTYYKNELEISLKTINKPLNKVTTEDIKYFLACYQLKGSANNTSIDNRRRVLNTFFQWLEDEEYILKNPVKRIKKIKQQKKVKKAFNFEEIERLKISCKTKRELAIVEVLLSTGVRIDELVNIKLKDISSDLSEISVVGKGNKQRYVYLNASSVIRIKDYLYSKKCESEFLFSKEISPYTNMKSDHVRAIIKEIGERANVEKTHPHRFRRTFATVARKRGMPIEEISKILGHEDLSTTQIYLQVDDCEVKKSHEKYMN
ncbi:hypothetical protein FHH43_01345 [Clostridium perfringens]|nr:hypothetical protein [Clostridium perfringens]